MSKTQQSDQCDSHVCPHKMAWMLDNCLRKWFQSPKKIVGDYISEGNTVIDFGCGPGFFTTEMALLVGEEGKVIAVDLQEEMLSHVRRKATRKKIVNRISFHQCHSDSIGLKLEEKADFMLAFYMVHETPNPEAFLQEAKMLLKKGGKFLIVEPKMHVEQAQYEELIASAMNSGFIVIDTPKKKGGRSILLSF